MIDLMLTEKGDLLFVSNIRKENKISLQFLLTDTSGVNINFFLNDFKEAVPNTNQIKLSFDLLNNQFKSQSAKLLTNLQAYRQACLYRINTSLKELPHRETIGSYKEKVMHKFLYDKATIEEMNVLIKKAIADILPNAKVTSIPVAKQTINGYKQTMIIRIYSEDIIILEYELR